MSTLQNKVALITGASRGIGRATALAISAAGARVLIHYGKSAQEAESLAELIRNQGGKADVVGADLNDAAGATTLATEVRKLIAGHLDILVLNAGISKAGSMEDLVNSVELFF